ncbi:hypothetical protein [Ferrimonas pelagia]
MSVFEFEAADRTTLSESFDAGYTGVTLRHHSEASGANAYESRSAVTGDSCSICHTNEHNDHKMGAYADGGLAYIACPQQRSGSQRSSNGTRLWLNGSPSTLGCGP